MTIPTFLVVGGARCGTTGLVEGLRAHPQVFVTAPKEPHYFALHESGAHFTAPGDDSTINRVAVTDREAYLALYPRDHAFAALGDASVSTMYYAEQAMPEVVRMNPDIKLVALLREPVERAYSAHQYMRARGLEPVEDFLEAVALEEERRRAGWHHIWHYTGMSRYAESLSVMQRAVPDGRLGVWFYDDLNRDYTGTLDQILRFLGIDPDPAAAEVPRVNVSGQPKYRAVHSALSWATANEPIRAAVKRATSYRFRERVRRTILRTDGLPVDARRTLEPLFADDVRRLRGLVPLGGPDWLLREGGEP